jgi:DMSO/TMAO reductase YedYZ molybdopterin-dependent catalytic subunit
MAMKKQHIHQKRMVHISGILRFSVAVTLFLLILFFMINPQTAHSQESPPVEEPAAEHSADAPTMEPSQDVILPSCTVPPIVVPTLPDEIPGYTQLDPDTQLHVTGTAQVIELENYTLEITGKVKHSLKLAYDDLRCMPKIEARPTLVCPGFFEDTASWAGVPLQYILELAGVEEEAERIRLESADGYATSVPIETALSDENFLAYEWEGEPIPILHGFPVRAIFPELQGNKWAKWLVKIEVQ